VSGQKHLNDDEHEEETNNYNDYMIIKCNIWAVCIHSTTV